jgi:hypothetical protein
MATPANAETAAIRAVLFKNSRRGVALLVVSLIVDIPPKSKIVALRTMLKASVHTI